MIESFHASSASQYFINLEDKYGAHNYHPLPVVLKRKRRFRLGCRR